MYFSFASKDKGSCNVSTCKFIRFPLNSYTFHALIWFLRPNSPINGRFSIFLYLFAIGVMTVPFRFCSSFNQILAGSLRGSGDAKGPMCIMLFSFVVCRQIYLFFVTKIAFNEYTVGMGYPVGWIVCAILSFLYYRRSRWEEKVKED